MSNQPNPSHRLQGPNRAPVLYIFAGLPGAGKTTLSRLLAQHQHAFYLRIDTIERSLRDLFATNIQGEGYRLAYKVAADQLNLGMSVVADSCNPIQLTRAEWQQVAHDANAHPINIEILCSDAKEHRSRVTTRKSNIIGLVLPTWPEVVGREYHEWQTDRLVIDTAHQTIEESFHHLLAELNSLSS